MKKNLLIKRMCFIALFGAIAGVLYLLKFPLPIFPSFLEINFTMLPVIICSFMLGPVDAIFVVIIRFLVKLIWGSHTVGVGEIADLMMGTVCALAAALPYKFLKCKHKDLISLGILIVVWIVSGVLSNWLYSIPQYLKLYFNGDVSALVGAMSVIPGINETNYMEKYLFCAVMPFNAILSVTVSFITLLVHKRLKVVYDQFNFEKSEKEVEENMNEELDVIDSKNDEKE